MSVRGIKIAEQFYSLQGEGALSGIPMYFVRVAGCHVHDCPLHPAKGGSAYLCDTDWMEKDRSLRPSVDDITAASLASGAKWLCITGGEPVHQLDDVVQLAAMARQNGQQVMIQTSGFGEIPESAFDWIVVSPKMHLVKMKQTRGHELKFVWNGEDFGYLRAMSTQTQFLTYYLQPLCQRDGSTNIAQVSDVVLKCGKIGIPFRLGVQQHKLWGGQ